MAAHHRLNRAEQWALGSAGVLHCLSLNSQLTSTINIWSIYWKLNNSKKKRIVLFYVIMGWPFLYHIMKSIIRRLLLDLSLYHTELKILCEQTLELINGRQINICLLFIYVFFFSYEWWMLLEILALDWSMGKYWKFS